MSASSVLSPRYSSWLHAWAVLTVCATLALLALGGIVTTFRVGMADPIWPTYPWHLALISWQESSPGFLIEHGHRLAGYVVGCCVIGLAIGLWQRGGILRWLGAAALLAVIAQGLLGGFRVRLNALVGTDLSIVHGCFAQVVFALLVSLALLTSRGWAEATATLPASEGRRMRSWAWHTTGLIFLQLVFGAFLRHTHAPLSQRGHLLVAFGVVAAAVGLAQAVLSSRHADRALTGAVKALAALLVLQLVLGTEAWLLKFASGGLPELQAVTARQATVRTAHVLVGACILATSVVVTLQVHRRAAAAPAAAPVPLGRLEGAA
jgi:heme a synthase